MNNINIITFLKGKKTYLVAGILILQAILGYVDGSLNQADFIRQIIEAFGLGALRAGITKSGPA
jgi:hypothetical protein